MMSDVKWMLVVLSCFLATTGVIGLAHAIDGVAVGCSFCGHSTSYPYHYQSCRYYGRGLSQGGGSATASAPNDAKMKAVQGMLPMLQQAIQSSLQGDPQQDARKAQGLAALADRQRQLEAEKAVQDQLIHDRLRGYLKLSVVLDVGLKNVDFDSTRRDTTGENPLGLRLGESSSTDDGLRAQGTSFFGLGGGVGGAAALEPPNDPKVVDLRNCRRAAFLAQAAAQSATDDSERLLDEAIKAAQGDRSLVAEVPRDSAPPVSEAGLAAFQKANIEYRRTHDLRLKEVEVFQQAQLRRELAAQAANSKRTELEKQLADGMNSLSLEEKHRRMAEIFDAAKAEYDAWLKAKSILDASLSRDLLSRALLLGTLREVSVSAPSRLPETIRQERAALEPSLDERNAHGSRKPEAYESANRFDAFVNLNYQPAADPGIQQRLQRMADQLQALSPYPDEPCRLRVVGPPLDPAAKPIDAQSTAHTMYLGERFLADDSKLGAGITNVFLLKLHPELDPQYNEDALKFIIGHEMAHMQRDHVSLTGEATVVASNTAVAGLGTGRWNWLQVLTEEPQPISTHPAMESRLTDYLLHDRHLAQETEVDRLGMTMALAAGARPQGILRAFKWIQEQSPRDPNEDRFGTHPTAEARVENLRKIWGPALGELSPPGAP